MNREQNETLLDRVRRVLRDDGLGTLVHEGRHFGIERGVEHLHRLNGNWAAGTSLWEQEWDCYIILDACRLDLMREVVREDAARNDPRWPRLHCVGSMRSLGSASDEWMERNFGDDQREEMSRTAHVTGNLFSRTKFDADDWAALDEAWRDGWDKNLSSTPAEAITDRAIARGRSHDGPLIVHYMQPHYPFVDADFGHQSVSLDETLDSWAGYDGDKTIWHRLRDGEVSRDTVWEAYRMNLEYVLDEVVRLLDNLDADRVLITADHGNALGEWGIWGHPPGVAIDTLREVPLIATTATDRGTYEPMLATPSGDDLSEDDVQGRLRDLGYL